MSSESLLCNQNNSFTWDWICQCRQPRVIFTLTPVQDCVIHLVSSSKTAHRERKWSNTTCAGPGCKGPGTNRYTNASIGHKLPRWRKSYMECTHGLINFWAVGTAGCMLEHVHCLRRSGLVPSTKQTNPVSDFILRVWMNIPLECPKNLLYESHLRRFWGNIESKIWGIVSFGSERWHSSQPVCLYVFIILMLWIK